MLLCFFHNLRHKTPPSAMPGSADQSHPSSCSAWTQSADTALVRHACGGTYRRLHSPHSPPGKFLSGNLWKIFSGRLYTLWWELRNVLLRQLVCCSSRPNKDRPLFLLKKRAVKTQHHLPTWRGSQWRDVICLIFFFFLPRKAADNRAAVMFLTQQLNATDWRICLLSIDPGDLV